MNSFKQLLAVTTMFTLLFGTVSCSKSPEDFSQISETATVETVTTTITSTPTTMATTTTTTQPTTTQKLDYTETEFHDNGKKTVKHYEGGKLVKSYMYSAEGEEISYSLYKLHSNGEIKEEKSYNHSLGSTNTEFFDESGVRTRKVFETKDGTTIETFYENGKTSKEIFRSDFYTSTAYYGSNGKKTEEITYSDGELFSKKYYWSNGNKKEELKYTRGDLFCIEYYNSSGKLIDKKYVS